MADDRQQIIEEFDEAVNMTPKELEEWLQTEEGAALEWTTQGTSNGDSVSYGGVSILEIEGNKVRRFMAYFNTRDLTPQVVD